MMYTQWIGAQKSYPFFILRLVNDYLKQWFMELAKGFGPGFSKAQSVGTWEEHQNTDPDYSRDLWFKFTGGWFEIFFNFILKWIPF